MIDLHTHSAISDGTDTVPELIRNASQAGIDRLSLTDHDTMDGVELAQECGRIAGIEVLRGMEMSTHVVVDGVKRSVHLLAYGCLPEDPELASLLEAVVEARRTRVPRMLELLAGLGMPLELGEVQAQSARAFSVGRPHVADAMVARGYVANRDEAFRDYLHDLGPAYVTRYTPTLFEAVDAINRACGVAVVAHPWGRGSREFLTEELIAEAGARGLYGIEVDHTDHGLEERQVLRELARDLGLRVTGSSDYHGTGKTKNPLGVFSTAVEVYEAIRNEIEERGGRP